MAIKNKVNNYKNIGECVQAFDIKIRTRCYGVIRVGLLKEN